MSYGFSIASKTADGMLATFDKSYDEVVANQPIHEKDRELARKHLENMLAFMGEPPEGQQYGASCNGYIAVRTDTGVITTVSVSSSVSHVTPSA